MKGYKGFNKDLTCQSFKYEIGKTYKIKEKPRLCERGFHFCNSLQNVFEYYPLHKKHTFCEIEAYGDLVSDGDYKKYCTNKIKIIRELDLDEILNVVGIKDKDLFIKYYDDDRFDVHQMFLIYYGLREGLDVSVYAKPEFNYGKMYLIYCCLREGLDVSVYAKPEFKLGQFNNDQMYLIYYGLKKGLDVSTYAKPELSYGQMYRIYLKLKEEKRHEDLA